MRDRSSFVLCIPARSMGRRSTKTVLHLHGTKALRSLVRDEFYWVASAAASAALRALPSTYLGCGATPCIHLHLMQRGSRDLISASLSLTCATGALLCLASAVDVHVADQLKTA